MKKFMSLVLLSIMICLVGCEENTNENIEEKEDVVEIVSNEEIYLLTDTGQNKLYDLDGKVIEENEGLIGQDANYQGIEQSFNDNGDGTVTDNVTGLMWQQVPIDETFNFEEANEYASSLELAGYDDWRVPTVKELFNLSNFATGWPYIDENYFELAASTGGGGGSVSKAGQFWTSNYYEVGTTHGGADSAFGVNHATGHIKAYPADTPNQMGKYVRVVRGEDTTNNNFIDNDDGTITDVATNLMWMQDDNGSGVEWSDALDYCETLEHENYSDWRLPDVKQLQSIVDYSGVYPAIDENYFDFTELAENENYYYWTSTSAYFSESESDYVYAWYVAFGYAVNDENEDTHGAGAVRFSAKYASSDAQAEGGDNFLNSVRCVRSIDD